MEYLYFLGNASLTSRVVQYLHQMPQPPVKFVTVIHQIDGWVIRIKMNCRLACEQDKNFRAFLNEFGVSYDPPLRLNMALASLEAGQTIVNVMQRYQVIVVSHGIPDMNEIEAFRLQFTKGLGYCPETLA